MFLIWGREVENIQEIWEAIAGIQNARSSCESAAKAIRAKVKRIKGRRLSVRIQKARGRAKVKREITHFWWCLGGCGRNVMLVAGLEGVRNIDQSPHVCMATLSPTAESCQGR